MEEKSGLYIVTEFMAKVRPTLQGASWAPGALEISLSLPLSLCWSQKNFLAGHVQLRIAILTL